MNDLNDTQGGTTVGGIHLGAMGGTLDLLQRCYSGLEMREGILWFNPLLPKPVKRLAFHCHYRENLLKIEITPEQLMIQASFCHAKNIQIGVLGQLHTLQAGETKTFRLE
jgi:trehalose/maltose hydrolase-like predicted phosphorylase